MPKRQLTRRSFLGTALGAAAFHHLHAVPLPSSERWVLLGSGTGEGIYRARWNAVTGELSAPELSAKTSSPTYLALHPHKPVLYACNEGSGAGAMASAFALNRSTASLTAMDSQPAGGDAPCYVSVDHTGALLFTANYSGGSLTAYPLDRDGQIKPAARLYKAVSSGPGPVADRQEGPHIHCAVVSPDNRFVLACDLGSDAILIFPIRPGTANPLGDPQRVEARRGSGPRHIAFHPNGRWFYCIHELDCTVDRYTWKVQGQRATAELAPDSAVRLVASPPTSGNAAKPVTGAEVAITRDGGFLYSSVRGADQLDVFSISERTGQLNHLQALPCGGVQPRFFALDPTERFLLCAHQEGNSVTTFARDSATGTLTQRSTRGAANPQCIVWL